MEPKPNTALHKFASRWFILYWRIIMTWRYFQATTQERSVHGSTHACAYIWSLEKKNKKNYYVLKAFLSLTQDDWQIVRTILVSLCWYFLYPFINSIKGRQETLHSGVKNEKCTLPCPLTVSGSLVHRYSRFFRSTLPKTLEMGQINH